MVGSQSRRTVRAAALAVVLGVLLTGATPVSAADPTTAPSPKNELGLGVGPSRVVLAAGQTQGKVTVYNAGLVDEQITGAAFDFVIDSAGNRVPATEPLPVGAARWIATDPAKFVLKPGESQIVSFSVTIPSDATPGDHYASVGILATMTDADWQKHLDKVAGGGSAATVRSQIMYPVTVVVRAPGAVVNALTADLAGLPSLQLVWDSNGYTFRPKIVNAGNVAAYWQPSTDSAAPKDPDQIVPTIRLSSRIPFLASDQLLFVRDRNGIPVNVLVLPANSHTQQIQFADVQLIGDYDLTYTLPGNDADGRATVTATGHITLINMQKVFLFIVLPLLVLILLLLLRTWRKRQDRKYRSRVREEAMREARAALEREAAEARGAGPQGPSGGGPRSGTIR